MIGRPMDLISEVDLQRLVANEIGESGTLDYKSSLPGGADRDKAEFIKDVVSMANANGGDLVFGVVEAGGIATALPGVACVDSEAEKNRLTQLIESNTDPRLTQVQVGSLRLTSGAHIFIVRVEPSLGGPFRISLGGKPSGFPKRLGTTTVHMDVFQIREDIMRASSAWGDLEQFRQTRLGELSGHYSRRNQVAAILRSAMDPQSLHYPTIVVHAIPMAALRGTSGPLDSRRLLGQWSDFRLLRDGVRSTTRRFNHLGLLVSDTDDRIARTQIFRDGRIEQAMALARTDTLQQGGDGLRLEMPDAIFDLPLAYLERRIVDTTRANIALLANFDMSWPFVIGVSLLHSNRLKLLLGDERFQDDAQPCDVHEIHCELSEVHTSESLDFELRYSFDHLWNAYGIPSSPSYDDDGRLRTL